MYFPAPDILASRAQTAKATEVKSTLKPPLKNDVALLTDTIKTPVKTITPRPSGDDGAGSLA
jgi:hypothetical protein